MFEDAWASKTSGVLVSPITNRVAMLIMTRLRSLGRETRLQFSFLQGGGKSIVCFVMRRKLVGLLAPSRQVGLPQPILPLNQHVWQPGSGPGTAKEEPPEPTVGTTIHGLTTRAGVKVLRKTRHYCPRAWPHPTKPKPETLSPC